MNTLRVVVIGCGLVGLLPIANAAEGAAPTEQKPTEISAERRARFAVNDGAPVLVEDAEWRTEDGGRKTVDGGRRTDVERRTEGGGREAAVVRDVVYQGAPGTALDRVAAWVVKPKETSIKAAVLWVHWLGDPRTTNRSQFLEEAIAMAERGVVSVLPDTLWAKPKWYQERVLEEDDDNSVAQVVALRRALALLRQEAGLEVPVAIVGHDYGGMYATIAAAVDRPVRTCVFIAVTPSLLDWAFYLKKPESMEKYVADNRDFELRDFAGALQGASVFMQFAEKDKYVPLPKALEYFSAASGRKQMNVYSGASHAMVKPETIQSDRTAWLVRELLGERAERLKD